MELRFRIAYVIALGATALLGVFAGGWLLHAAGLAEPYSAYEAGFDELSETADDHVAPPQLATVTPPIKVGIQAGHYKNDEVPEELSGLKQNGAGAISGEYVERDIVYEIAVRTVSLLNAEGIDAELVPATVPSGYQADAFVSIHADASQNPTVSGFKIAAPHIDGSGNAEALQKALYASYSTETGLPKEPTITRRMRGYYAFNWRRYEHAIHPTTPAVIIETGYVTSATDREVIVTAPERAARGIAEGVQAFLAERTETR